MLKNVQARRGAVPEGEHKKIRRIVEQGRSSDPIKKTLKQRKDLNLPELKAGLNTEEVDKLFQALATRKSQSLGTESPDKRDDTGD